jgi:uncharacterized protein YndB with AHSA1/START domain
VTEPVVKSIRVSCSISEAFVTFTQRVDLRWPKSHRRFDESDLILEPCVGGRFFERSTSGEEARLGEVIICDPPSRLSYTWYPGAISAPTRVDVVFEPDADETVVHVTHSEGQSALGDQWPRRAKRFDEGWDAVLPLLQRCIERAGRPTWK